TRFSRDWSQTCALPIFGVPLPVPPILAALPTLKENLSAARGNDAARAIMTTDTFTKEYAVAYQHDGREIRIGGMAKGSGMIEPKIGRASSRDRRSQARV